MSPSGEGYGSRQGAGMMRTSKSSRELQTHGMPSRGTEQSRAHPVPCSTALRGPRTALSSAPAQQGAAGGPTCQQFAARTQQHPAVAQSGAIPALSTAGTACSASCHFLTVPGHRSAAPGALSCCHCPDSASALLLAHAFLCWCFSVNIYSGAWQELRLVEFQM